MTPRVLIPGLLLAGALGTLLWLRPGMSPAPAARADPEASPELSLRLREGSIILRHGGIKQAQIRARRVTVSADLRFTRLSDITQATIYQEGAPALDVSAQEIVMDRRTSDLEIRGPVVVTFVQGYRLTAPSARWRHALQHVMFTDGVHIWGRGEEIVAASLMIDVGRQLFELAGNVDITFRLGGAGP